MDLIEAEEIKKKCRNTQKNDKRALEKALESPLDCKEIQPVHSEGDQP